ncbi:hypothetical protein ABT124_32555 [Streptomyces sp. NPDC001982]|uniref:hypothetical protein n=1 Tax=unclassified Streptomyces TaxID=2593676 RepID=UPI00331736EA
MQNATDPPTNSKEAVMALYGALLEHCAGCAVCLGKVPTMAPCPEERRLFEAYRAARRAARGGTA